MFSKRNKTIAAAATAVAAFALLLTGTQAGAAVTPEPSGASGGIEPTGTLANPYAGARVYVNPDWTAKANAEPGGSAISNQPTAVWMDRRVAITGTTGARGLRAHLDTALAQGANLVQVVIYNLPGRDCAALASNGELEPDQLDVYQSEYIDPIAEIEHDPAYASLRIVNIIEIDSLPNLITNVGGRDTATPECDVMLANGNYVNGVGYALGTLAASNVYNYIDIGHHGWLGWDDNFQPFVQLVQQTANANGATPADIHGFASNVANYGVLDEPFFTENTQVGGRPVREGTDWIDWNRYVDEISYVQAYKSAFTSALGHPVSMLIDTSRNGWGGSDRPTSASTSTDPNTFVNESKTDRRIHLGNWCNQSGAGIGERPRANPTTGVDAYVWIKPPGESDGSSEEIDNDEGKGFDQMCDPAYEGNARNRWNMSGALPNAPLSGHWFSAQFQELLANAYPPL
jgi:cellulose 1,4-beta-cellobiosidase